MTHQPVTLRRVWTDVVQPDDYDAHMAAVGQAQANAELVPRLLQRWPPSGRRLLVAGAGTGQMFDFAGTAFLDPYDITFTDVNAQFLRRLADRLGRADFRHYNVVVDDVEQSGLRGPFAGALLVLVLEHVKWLTAVATLRELGAGRCYFVIQQNPPDVVSALAAGRPAAGSMSIFREARPTLLAPHLLIAAMDQEGYSLLGTEERNVLDGKKMMALAFARTREAVHAE